MRTEQFLEGFDECRDEIISILKLNLSNEQKLEKIRHLAEYSYYDKDEKDKIAEEN
jgi:hypothetical protein